MKILPLIHHPTFFINLNIVSSQKTSVVGFISDQITIIKSDHYNEKILD